MQERLAKVLAHAGIASRRKAETLILQGRIYVNDQVIQDVAFHVDKDKDQITLDGIPIKKDIVPKLWLYHKPKGLMTTHHDPFNRPTVFEEVQKHIPERLISVGRLDFNTEGLLLMTNYGPLARQLEKSQLKRVYKVKFFGPYHEKAFAQIKKNFTIEGVHYQAFEIEKTADKWLHITICEGKNREIRKALAYVGVQVSRLIRIAYGPYHLGSLQPSQILKTDLPQNFEF